jgi:nucleoside-diphosphate-sugar epimerase
VASVSKYCVIGKHGLLGGAFAEHLGAVTSYPTPDTRVVFHFGGYTHNEFARNPDYFIRQTIESFTTLLPYCYERGIPFVYPSSALVYEQETTFSRFKKTLEQLAGCYKTMSLGLRIFPVYGPTEPRSVISKWCRQMAAGERPVVYGDGTQKRDFIYIDDVVDQVLSLVKEPCWKSRIVDIGTGVATSFNHIVESINAELGTELQPQYVQRPSSYSEGILCPQPLPVKVSIESGIQKILKWNLKNTALPQSSRPAGMLTAV